MHTVLYIATCGMKPISTICEWNYFNSLMLCNNIVLMIYLLFCLKGFWFCNYNYTFGKYRQRIFNAKTAHERKMWLMHWLNTLNQWLAKDTTFYFCNPQCMIYCTIMHKFFIWEICTLVSYVICMTCPLCISTCVLFAGAKPHEADPTEEVAEEWLTCGIPLCAVSWRPVCCSQLLLPACWLHSP